MGYVALAGRPGIVSIRKGWEGLSEVDRVVYDPEVITVEDMIGALKAAGTYKVTLSVAESGSERRNKENEPR